MPRATRRRGRARRPRSCAPERGTPCPLDGEARCPASPRCSRSSASSVSRAKRSPWLSTADAVSAPTSSEKGRTAYPRASTSADDSPLHVVELGAILRKATPAGAVGEHAVVELVGRADAALLERGRDPVDPVRERRFCLCIVDATVASAGRLPYRRARGRRLLHLSRLPATSARARSCAGSCGAVRALRPGSARRARASPSDHNLERTGAPPRWAGVAGDALKWGLERAGGYGGDFATVLASLATGEPSRRRLLHGGHGRDPAHAPARAPGRLRPPLVYVAIGLPERLAQLRSDRMRRLYASALGSCASVIAYSAVRGRRASRLARAPWLCHASRVRPLRRRRRRPSRRFASRPPSTSSRSAPTRIATSRSSCASRRACPL